LNDIPETSVILFSESEVDKRGRLYKKITEKGCPVEFLNPADGELTAWIGNMAGKYGLKISKDNAYKLLRSVSRDMNALSSEIAKLTAFASGRAEITSDDIDSVCSPSLETRIFDLISSMAFGKTGEALFMFRNMISMKEQPLMILAMISRQFRLILQCKSCAEDKMTVGAAAKLAGIKEFVVNECLRQGKRYKKDTLFNALEECQKTDVMIKTGAIDPETGIEILIVKYAN
jgi:DNA polymerase-3 subunit delta